MNKILRNFSIKNGFCLLAAALALVTTGCEKDHADAVGSSEEEVLLTSEAQVYPLTIHATKTAWKATCTENWITLSQAEGIGTEHIELTVQANTLSASRTATIQLAMNSGANAKIVIKQQGLSDTEIRVSPEMITAKPYYTAPKYAFTLEVRNKVADPANDITMAVNYMGDSKNWIKNFSIIDVPNSSYHLTSIYSFETEDNTMADAREAEIVFTVKYGHNTYTKAVKVYQNGLHTPAVATAENIYMRHNQTEHMQTIWLNDGDQTNVDYKVEFSSTQSGTGVEPETADGGWFTAEAVKDAAGDYLKITSRINTYDETRKGDIYIIASRPNNNNIYASTAKLRIHVTQAGHKAAGLSLPISEVVHTYVDNTAAVLPYMLPINALNDSKIAASTDADWIHIDGSMLADNMLGYRLDQFTGGITGNFREAVITLQATNGHSNAANYSLTVRQYAPEMPGISGLPEYLGLGYEAVTDATLEMNPLNGASIEQVGTPSANWLTASVTGNSLTYSVTANTEAAAVNYSREAVITLKASNTNGNAAYFYITVHQYARDMAYLDKTSISMAGHTYLNQSYVNPAPQTITVNNVPQGSDNTITWTNSGTTGNLVNVNSNYKFGFAKGSFESQIVVSHSYNGLSGYYNTLTNYASLYITVNAYPYKQYFTVPCTMVHSHQQP